MGPALYFIENLTFRSWLFSALPRLLGDLIRFKRGTGKCYVIDGSGPVLMLAKGMAKIAGLSLEKLDFRLADVYDESGLPIRLRILHRDLAQMQQYILDDPVLRELEQSGTLRDRLPMFLAKKISSNDWSDRTSIWRTIVLIQVCAWHCRQQHAEGASPVLFLERRPWHSRISRYAEESSVTIVPVHQSSSFSAVLRRWLPHWLADYLRRVRYRKSLPGVSGILNRFSGPKSLTGDNPNTVGHAATVPGTANGLAPRVGVEYYGMLNLNQPERHSDLFFWQQSNLSGSDLLLTFSIPNYSLDAGIHAQLTQHGMGAVVLHPGATALSDAPVFKRRNRLFPSGKGDLYTGLKTPEGAWLNRQHADYHAVRAYWTDLASSHNIKVFVSWHKYHANHCAIADALRSVEGITAFYQRAFEDHPSGSNMVAADILFGFSPEMAEIERQSNSSIGYHVATGYLGDHRAALLAKHAQPVRDGLRQHGAKHILAYFDENSVDDARWTAGHHVPQHDYGFLLEKVLAEPWLGLVIKPKVPGTLRRRLGPVAKMLDQAVATGRCYVFEADPSSPSHGGHPPVEAALAADLAIHGYLTSATAGIEASLAGVPTLLLDQEGWSVSPLYTLGEGTVVFTSWDQLWEACRTHWSSEQGIPGFGDWSSMLNQIDPFRDGRAAERMGTYIQWLIQGFKDGLDRESVMADAAERYCAQWGRDKITQVNGGLWGPSSSGVERNQQSLLVGS